MADTGTANAPDGDRAAGEPGDSPTNPEDGGGRSGIQAVIHHVNTDRVEACMWLSRMVTMIFTISFIIPFFGVPQHVSGQRVLIAGAITSALRLHQRMPQVQLNRAFLGLLFMEDSAHYLLYSILMLLATNANVITLAPVFLFALLHVTKYTKTLLNLLGPTSLGIVRKLILQVDTRQREILRLIAVMEITTMPITIIFILSNIFHEMRMFAEYATDHPNCPNIVRGLIPKAITLICRMSPVQQAPAQ